MRLSESEIQGMLCAVRNDASNGGCSRVPSPLRSGNAVKHFQAEALQATDTRVSPAKRGGSTGPSPD